MYIRKIETELLNQASNYPIVTVIGPRQSGKTTLVQKVFTNKPYVNLEAPDIRERIQFDPRGFLAQYPDGVILDEIQRLPELLSYIQTIVDQKQDKGLFILTGSHQLELHQAITQSLAGRTALITLLPLSIAELAQAGLNYELDEYLLNGFYPRIYKDKLNPTKAYRGYFQTYIERDVRLLTQVADLTTFQRFVKLCAGRIGQVLNLNSLCNETGISHPTASRWLSILEASFVIFQLQPYFENFGKRIIKSPKLYFTDVGLATYLLDIENITQLRRDPLRGNLVENMVILELYKARLNQGMAPSFYYYRDNHQHEVDVIYKKGHQLIPIEIKASQTFNKDFLKEIHYFRNLVTNRCSNSYLIYAGETQLAKETQLLNYKQTSKIIEQP